MKNIRICHLGNDCHTVTKRVPDIVLGLFDINRFVQIIKLRFTENNICDKVVFGKTYMLK